MPTYCPSSGAISMANIYAAFPNIASYSLSSYRGVTYYYSNGSSGTFPSTNLSMSAFYSTTGTSPSYAASYLIVAGGGSGGGDGGRGGGGGAGGFVTGSTTLTGGTVYTVTVGGGGATPCLLYTSPSPRDRQKSRMPSSA